MVSDLHIWPLGPGKQGVSVSIVSDHPRSPDHYKKLLADRPEFGHLTVEVNQCMDHGGLSA
jgi:Co/Zn/Cd efflux system component